MPLLTVETLAANELAAMAAYDQGVALNEILSELARIGRESAAARTRWAQARKALLGIGRESAEFVTFKRTEIDAKTTLDNLRERARTMRDIRSILQTLIRSIPA